MGAMVEGVWGRSKEIEEAQGIFEGERIVVWISIVYY